MTNKNEAGAPLNSATNESANAQSVGNNPQQSAQRQMGAPPPVRVKRGKGGRKSKTTVLSKGLSEVRIEHEDSRAGRKPWRVSWFENGEQKSEMHATYDDAYTAAEAKLNQLADGQRTLTRQELTQLFAFKLEVEAFNQRLAASERTLDQVVSDAIAAGEILPGWTASQMAQFIVEHHGVKNPMLVEAVAEKFLEYMASGYKWNYSDAYLKNASRVFRRFVTAFTKRHLHLVTEIELLDYITNYRVKPKTRKDRERAGNDGLVPADGKTRNMVHNLLNLLFDHAKQVLGALPRRLDTAMAMLEAPGYDVPTPEIYIYAEVERLYALMPDLECVLFVSLQLFAGLRPCECLRMRKKDIRRDANGKLLFIFVRQEVGKKSPVTGRRKIRTRKAPITPPLAAVLNSMEFQDGRLFASLKIGDRVRSAAKAGKFVWKYDALRHSFISYRLAVLKDRAQVAYEAGHGVDVQIEHYEGLIEDLQDVPKFWSFAVPLNLPATLNYKIIGMKAVRAYKAAKAQAENVIPLTKVA